MYLFCLESFRFQQRERSLLEGHDFNLYFFPNLFITYIFLFTGYWCEDYIRLFTEDNECDVFGNKQRAQKRITLKLTILERFSTTFTHQMANRKRYLLRTICFPNEMETGRNAIHPAKADINHSL